MTGKFITIEGSEGAGKSTAINYLRDNLKVNRKVVFTREPGGTPLAEKIREVLLCPAEETVWPETELLLLYAARVQHWREKIQPALRQGAIVVCDRFTDATLAYQGYGRGVDLARIRQLDTWALQGVQPDVTFYLDVPIEIGLERITNRAGGPDRFEREQRAFFEKVRAGYLSLAEQSAGRIQVIDATRPVHVVCEDLLLRMKQVLGDE
ncbi:MAG: dTMP kinase [Gammaproteobacteria bacterium]|nr:MAG: dTMP kinase [Gammaproteobacteria bacterium]